MISDDRLQKALTYMASTDEPAAKAKALVEGLSEQKKTVKALVFANSSGGVSERNEKACASKQYIEHLGKLEQAIYDYEILKNKRLTESLVISVWQSLNANRRAGNIT